MSRLRFFEIDAKLGPATVNDFDILSFLTGSLCTSLTSPATLEHLKVNILFRGYNNLFLFQEERFFEDLRHTDAWARLDSITSHPTGSRLQRVDINIEYHFRLDDDGTEPHKDDVLNAVLDRLPLLRTKGILFIDVGPVY